MLFFLAEVLIYLKSLSANFQMFWPTNRSPDATRLSELVTAGRYLPDVDIFLPSYSEPVEMLRRTILGCQALRYPRKQIYLLDDQRRPQMRALAQELGCHYRDRPDNRDAKAGNMNAALPSSRGELIAVFDADFIPTQDFLERTVGFFSDSRGRPRADAAELLQCRRGEPEPWPARHHHRRAAGVFPRRAAGP